MLEDAGLTPLGVLAIGGGVLGIAFVTLVPAVWPRFKRPYVAAWAAFSLGPGGAAAISHHVIEGGSAAGALVWFVVTALMMAVIVPLLWLRIHQWSLIMDKAERDAALERFRRYRPKVFGD